MPAPKPRSTGTTGPWAASDYQALSPASRTSAGCLLCPRFIHKLHKRSPLWLLRCLVNDQPAGVEAAAISMQKGKGATEPRLAEGACTRTPSQGPPPNSHGLRIVIDQKDTNSNNGIPRAAGGRHGFMSFFGHSASHLASLCEGTYSKVISAS